MKLNEVHKDIERYFAEDCYCPHEVYSVDGFCYQLVFGDAECKVVGNYKTKDGEDVTFVITASRTADISSAIHEQRTDYSFRVRTSGV